MSTGTVRHFLQGKSSHQKILFMSPTLGKGLHGGLTVYFTSCGGSRYEQLRSGPAARG
jgi:hypothetical protein